MRARRITLKRIFKIQDKRRWLDWSGSRQGPVAGSCERRDEFSGSIKFGELLGYLRYYSIFKKDSVPWSLIRMYLDRCLPVCVCACVSNVRARDLVVRDALSHLIICKAMARFFIKLCTNIIPGFPPLKFINCLSKHQHADHENFLIRWWCALLSV
jgi:hypothetical protein